jgi:small subunit ribosomal protein S20
MANIRSAQKRIRQNEKRRTRNAAIRSAVRTGLRSARAAIDRGAAPEAHSVLAGTVRVLDKAVTKGVLHPNAAARRKSRLQRQANALAAK